MTKADFNWFAGFFEGEGFASCSIRQRKDYENGKFYPAKILMAGAAQVDRKPLDALQKEFGGSVHKKSLNKLSKLVCYEWHISCQLAKQFLMIILPYMRIPRKQKQIKIALEKYLSKGS